MSEEIDNGAGDLTADPLRLVDAFIDRAGAHGLRLSGLDQDALAAAVAEFARMLRGDVWRHCIETIRERAAEAESPDVREALSGVAVAIEFSGRLLGEA